MPDITYSPETVADDDLARRVVTFLADRHVPALRRLSVRARDGIVTLSGRVGSYHEKQLSHICTRRVAGVLGTVDQIEVRIATQRDESARPRPRVPLAEPDRWDLSSVYTPIP